MSEKILIKCCLCHHQVSINAACCPNCGEPDFESISLTTEIDSVLPVADEDADDEDFDDEEADDEKDEPEADEGVINK